MFGAAGIILYRGFFAHGGPSGQAVSAPAIVSGKAGEKILPYGGSLDFSLIKKFNGGTKFFNYPILSPDAVKVQLQDLVK